MRIPPKYNFFPFVIYDDNEDIVGIRDDAPEEAKEAFSEFMESRRLGKELNIDF